jgi:signal peptidase II
VRDVQAARGAPIAEPPAAETAPTSKAGRLKLRLLFFAVLAGGLLLDVVSKQLATRFLDPYSPVALLGGLFTLRLIRNPGAAFSLGEQFTYVFAALAVLVLIFILVRLVPTIGYAGWAVALGLLCAGIGGNLIDRIFRAPGVMRGHVVDFMQLPHWPIFNVADMCITAAAVLIIALTMIKNVGIDGRRFAGG